MQLMNLIMKVPELRISGKSEEPIETFFLFLLAILFFLSVKYDILCPQSITKKVTTMNGWKITALLFMSDLKCKRALVLQWPFLTSRASPVKVNRGSCGKLALVSGNWMHHLLNCLQCEQGWGKEFHVFIPASKFGFKNVEFYIAGKEKELELSCKAELYQLDIFSHTALLWIPTSSRPVPATYSWPEICHRNSAGLQPPLDAKK